MPDDAPKPAEVPAKKPSQFEVLKVRAHALFEKGVAAINARNAREKTMILGLAAALVLALDYFVLIAPIMRTYSKTLPQLAALGTERDGLRADRQNKELIARDWTDTAARVEAHEGRFVAPDELPALLGDLNELARRSGVKIVALKPLEAPAPSGRYSLVPLRMAGIAGTHELGAFLDRLENGPRFFRIREMKIEVQATGQRQHGFGIDFETYRVNAPLKSAKK